MQNNDEHRYKNPRWIATRAGIVCLLIAAWFIADDAYRNYSHKEYLQCVLQEASDYKVVGSTNIYKDPELSKVRDNCANSLGPEYMAWDDEISLFWFKSPLWKKVLLLPSYISGHI